MSHTILCTLSLTLSPILWRGVKKLWRVAAPFETLEWHAANTCITLPSESNSIPGVQSSGVWIQLKPSEAVFRASLFLWRVAAPLRVARGHIHSHMSRAVGGAAGQPKFPPVKRVLEYGVRAPVSYGNLREQTGENGFPRKPTGSLFCSYRNLRNLRNLLEFTGECNLGILHSNSL